MVTAIGGFAGLDLDPEVIAMLRSRPEILEAVTKTAKREYQSLEIQDFVTLQLAIGDLIKTVLSQVYSPGLFGLLPGIPEGRNLNIKLVISQTGIEVIQTGTPRLGKGNGTGGAFGKAAISVVWNGQTYDSCRKACIALLAMPDIDGCGNPHKHHKCKDELARYAKANSVTVDFVETPVEPETTQPSAPVVGATQQNGQTSQAVPGKKSKKNKAKTK